MAAFVLPRRARYARAFSVLAAAVAILLLCAPEPVTQDFQAGVFTNVTLSVTGSPVRTFPDSRLGPHQYLADPNLVANQGGPISVSFGPWAGFGFSLTAPRFPAAGDTLVFKPETVQVKGMIRTTPEIYSWDASGTITTDIQDGQRSVTLFGVPVDESLVFADWATGERINGRYVTARRALRFVAQWEGHVLQGELQWMGGRYSSAAY